MKIIFCFFSFFNSANIIGEPSIPREWKKMISLDLIAIFLSVRETQNEATGIRFRNYIAQYAIVKITRVRRLAQWLFGFSQTARFAHDEFHAYTLLPVRKVRRDSVSERVRNNIIIDDEEVALK